MSALHDGVTAVLYVALLVVASDVMPNGDSTIATRLRNTIVAGVGIPGLLGLVHLLYAPVLWLTLALAAIVALRKRQAPLHNDPWVWLAFAALTIVIWEPLCRPLLEGDSLEYHLPNAASWINAHSVWTTNASYWPYPPASELFAAGLLCAAGRFVLPLAGVLPALMLAARLIAVARARGAPGYAGAAVALAFLTMPLAAFQIGTLQNDLWLAAFFVEALATPSGSSFAVTALLKPIGWLVALIAAIAGRRGWSTYAWIALPLGVWLARDAILLPHAYVHDAAPGWSTTIAAHLGVAIPLFFHALVHTTPLLAVWIAVLIAGLFSPQRRNALAGLGVLVLFAVLPVTFASGHDTYLAWGTSLRYLLPAAAAGALVATAFASRAPIATAIAGCALAAIGSTGVVSVFNNDALAAFAPYAMVVMLAAAAIPWRRPFAFIIMAAVVVAVTANDASARAPGFYGDWMHAPNGQPTRAFEWIADHGPRRIATLNVRTGAVTMASPATWTLPLSDPATACEQARANRALLFIGSNESSDETALRQQLSWCGSALYRDGAAVIIAPN